MILKTEIDLNNLEGWDGELKAVINLNSLEGWDGQSIESAFYNDEIRDELKHLAKQELEKNPQVNEIVNKLKSGVIKKDVWLTVRFI